MAARQLPPTDCVNRSPDERGITLRPSGRGQELGANGEGERRRPEAYVRDILEHMTNHPTAASASDCSGQSRTRSNPSFRSSPDSARRRRGGVREGLPRPQRYDVRGVERASVRIRRHPKDSPWQQQCGQAGVPTGIRTPVTAVKGRCPRPG